MILLCFGSDNSFIEYIVYNLGCLYIKYFRCNILVVIFYMCVLMLYSFGDYEFFEGCVFKVYIIFLFVGSICDIYIYFY